MSESARRDRVRAATEREIRLRARGVLVSQGRDRLTLRAIASELGMTPPALYRYYSSREELLRAVSGDICTELAAAITEAGSGVTGVDRAAAVEAVLAACRAFRRWALDHPEEFGLVFATSTHGCPPECAEGCRCGHTDFARAFLAVAARLLSSHRIQTPAESSLPPSLATGLTRYRQEILDTFASTGAEVPPELVSIGAVYTFLQVWARLYGQVALEVFGKLRFAVDDPEPLFETMLADVAEDIGVPLPSGVSALSDT